MKKIDCDIIQDLLPSYKDGLLSDSSKELVNEHLRGCENCKRSLNEINMDINTDFIKQDEQIDFLKKHRIKKILSIIIAVIITALVLLWSLMIIQYYCNNTRFNVDVNDISVSGWQIGDEVALYCTDGKQRYLLLYDDDIIDSSTKTVYIRPYGTYADINNLLTQKFTGRTGYEVYLIDDTIDKIYLQDLNGNLRKLWEKSTGLDSSIEDVTTSQIKFRKQELEINKQLFNNK